MPRYSLPEADGGARVECHCARPRPNDPTNTGHKALCPVSLARFHPVIIGQRSGPRLVGDGEAPLGGALTHWAGAQPPRSFQRQATCAPIWLVTDGASLRHTQSTWPASLLSQKQTPPFTCNKSDKQNGKQPSSSRSTDSIHLVVGTTQWSAPRSPEIEVTTQNPSTLIATTTSAPSQPVAKCKGRRSKQQHGAGKHCTDSASERHSSQTPHHSPT